MVGLGGGLLPMFLHTHFDVADVTSIELDPAVKAAAVEFFGFREREGEREGGGASRVIVADGLDVVRAIAARAEQEAKGACMCVCLCGLVPVCVSSAPMCVCERGREEGRVCGSACECIVEASVVFLCLTLIVSAWCVLAYRLLSSLCVSQRRRQRRRRVPKLQQRRQRARTLLPTSRLQWRL